MSSSQKTSVIHWFRKGLRIHDNPSLLSALEKIDGCHHELRPVFVLDPLIAQKLLVGPNRWRFLLQSLADLDQSLRLLGSRLYVIRGTPEEVFLRIFKEWRVKRLTFEADIEPYARVRDAKIEELAKLAEVQIIKRNSHTLFNPEALIASNLGKAPLTYQKFLSLVERAGPPSKPLLPPAELPQECQLSSKECSSLCMNVPTLAELNIQESDCGPLLYPGGETDALKRMEKYLSDAKYVCQFEKPLTSPNSLESSTTVLSPYLKFGCLSPRTFYWKLKGVTNGKKHTQPPVSLMGQLMWREFYYTVGADTPNFDKMEGNKICTQIPWAKNDEWLSAWKEGRTGYPWIDAVMTQLRQEGWIHHLARHAVACFLTRGDLWISWEEGQKVFEEFLLDADWALNAGNWMWLSASAFFHQFFRVYSPVAFPKKTDKTGEYVRKYVPVLAKLPSEYIYEPWNAPKETLKKAGCVLGKDYPHRIVIHEVVHKKNIEKMSKAYKDNKAGKLDAGLVAKRTKDDNASAMHSTSISKKKRT